MDKSSMGEFDAVTSLTPVPALPTFAFIATRNGQFFVIANGREFGPYDSILGRYPPLFLPDGSVRFVALKGRQVIQITAALPSTKAPA